MASADLIAFLLEMSSRSGLKLTRMPSGVWPHSVSSAAALAADLDCVIIVLSMEAYSDPSAACQYSKKCEVLVCGTVPEVGGRLRLSDSVRFSVRCTDSSCALAPCALATTTTRFSAFGTAPASSKAFPKSLRAFARLAASSGSMGGSAYGSSSERPVSVTSGEDGGGGEGARCSCGGCGGCDFCDIIIYIILLFILLNNSKRISK